jgi:hypothetical protein
MAGCGNVFAIADGMGGVRDENGKSASAEVAKKAASAAVSQLLKVGEGHELDLDSLRDLRASAPGATTLLTAKFEAGRIAVNSLGDCQLLVIDGKNGRIKAHVPPANLAYLRLQQAIGAELKKLIPLSELQQLPNFKEHLENYFQDPDGSRLISRVIANYECTADGGYISDLRISVDKGDLVIVYTDGIEDALHAFWELIEPGQTGEEAFKTIANRLREVLSKPRFVEDKLISAISYFDNCSFAVMEILEDHSPEVENVNKIISSTAADLKFPTFATELPGEKSAKTDNLYSTSEELLPLTFEEFVQLQSPSLEDPEPEDAELSNLEILRYFWPYLEILRYLWPYLVVIFLAAGVSYQVVDILKPAQVERTDQQRVEAFLKEYLNSKNIGLELLNKKAFWDGLFEALTNDKFEGKQKDYMKLSHALRKMPKDQFENIVKEILDKIQK